MNVEINDRLEIIKEANDKIFKEEINSNIVFIYTPPKVGSTCLVTSLRISVSYALTVIHIHDEIMLSVLTNVNNVTINEIIKYNAHIGKKVYVIDVYRSPIERKMSEFFENISSVHFNNSDENVNKYNINRITYRFNKIFPYLANGDHYFEKYEIEPPAVFDFEKKYLILENDNIIYIKLRLKDSSEWNRILSEIFKANIVIINDYKTENKVIGDLYNRFKNEYKLPINLFELTNNCKYLNYFYNVEEKREYLDSWSQKLAPELTPYTEIEYKFYINLCFENQFYNDIQVEHYIDSGCLCNPCRIKRREIFNRAHNGETKFEKIIHTEVVNEHINNVNLNIVNKVNIVNKLISQINVNKNKNKKRSNLKHNLVSNIMNKNQK
jgi:hypothetical protein